MATRTSRKFPPRICWGSTRRSGSYPPTGDLFFDVLTRLGEFARFETVDAEIKEIDGTRVRVATPAALYRLKKGTVRAKDHQDAVALRDRFNLTDES